MALTEREFDFLHRVVTGDRLRLADRDEDRVRQKLRKLGLVKVVSSPRRWVLRGAGAEAYADYIGVPK